VVLIGGTNPAGEHDRHRHVIAITPFFLVFSFIVDILKFF
jgi:hypothetical protein